MTLLAILRSQTKQLSPHGRARVPGDPDFLPPGWDVLGAVPNIPQTAYASFTIGVDAQPGETLRIRGGRSSVGKALTVLAKAWG